MTFSEEANSGPTSNSWKAPRRMMARVRADRRFSLLRPEPSVIWMASASRPKEVR